jgi:hydroxymethylbilane synthase
VKIQTSGDRGNREALGAFVSEIEQSLRSEVVDAGLHCLKDVPTRPLDGLCFPAYLKREDPRDALITRDGKFSDLPGGAVIGTGSLRRTSQLAAHGKSFAFKPIYGNIDTRLRKLRDGEYDAIILAAAGLKRLKIFEELSPSVEVLEVGTMMPAPGQATLVIQMRERDSRAATVAELNDADTEIASISERSFLNRFGGGCSVPVASYAYRVDEHFQLSGLVAAPDGKVSYRGTKAFGSEQAEFFGRELAEELGREGAFTIIDEVVGRQLR